MFCLDICLHGVEVSVVNLPGAHCNVSTMLTDTSSWSPVYCPLPWLPLLVLGCQSCIIFWASIFFPQEEGFLTPKTLTMLIS